MRIFAPTSPSPLDRLRRPFTHRTEQFSPSIYLAIIGIGLGSRSAKPGLVTHHWPAPAGRTIMTSLRCAPAEFALPLQ